MILIYMTKKSKELKCDKIKSFNQSRSWGEEGKLFLREETPTDHKHVTNHIFYLPDTMNIKCTENETWNALKISEVEVES